MKKLLILVSFIFITAIYSGLSAQEKASNYVGAIAKKKTYKALYVLNSADEKHISATLRNMNNALEDPRLKGKLKLELIAFGDGVAVYLKDGKFLDQLNTLRNKGGRLAQCENTIRERKIDKSTLFDFINYVPSGNGEIISLSAEGWAIVHP